MVVELKKEVSIEKARELAEATQSILVENEILKLVTFSKIKELPAALETYTENFAVTPNDLQLASRIYKQDTISVKIGNDIELGGEKNNTLMMTGPCSVESEEQIETVSKFLVKNNIKVLRAGCYKPRTSPYSFQGMGLEGLQLLAKMREKYGLKVITEVRDYSHIEEVIEYSDVVQVGAKAMYDQGILRRCGKANKPVLIKRGFGSTLQEFAQAAEFVLSGGNENVILCERGIRTFEFNTRFTLDLCGVAWLKEKTNLPIVLDPSHALGARYGIADLSRACVAMGIDGLLIETHPDPSIAKSDAAQQLDFKMFEEMNASLKAVANAVGRVMI
ncbi:MAG: bifunctional 3-deoxy-7-phosphoheptulonate synthase/chorismate mutase [Chitinophagales bacterium]